MERCPDKETLEKFVDYVLTKEMNENILSHLSICDRCRDKVVCLLSEEQDLLKTLLSGSVSGKCKITLAPVGCLSKAAILAYAGKCLDEDQLRLVESHLQKCDNCLSALLRVQRSMDLTADLDLNMSVMKAALGMETHVLEIVLKTKDKFIELLRHTGELLSLTPELGTVRGKEEREDKPIVIRKDFEERDLSIEITLQRELVESEETIAISVMKLSNEEFLTGLAVELSGKAVCQKEKTTQYGIVEFYGMRQGKYDIKVAGEYVALLIIE